MDALDTTIINTAIPAMSKSLNVNPVDLKIALISYLLTLAIFIPTSGWVADRFGVKKIFIVALMTFTVSSLWCGFAHSLRELVVARCFQGLGGSFMLPLGRLLLLRTFPRHEFIEAMNQVIIVLSLGLMLGPFVGGFITDHLSWHWIFWINIPIGIIAITAASIWLKKEAVSSVRSFDLLGFLLFGGGLSALTFALSDISESTDSPYKAMYILCIALLMLISFYFYSHNRKHSIIKTELFKIRTFRISILGNLFARLGFGGIPFLFPLLLQIVLHYKAEVSGLLVAPIALGVLIIKYVSTKLLRFLGYKRLLMINTVMVGIALWMFLLIDYNTSVISIVFLTFIFGCLISLQYSGMNSLAYADLSPSDHSSAVSIISTMQQLSQGLGVATAALLLRIYSYKSVPALSLNPNVFHYTFITMGFLTIFSTLIFIWLKPNDGYQMLAQGEATKI